MDTRQKKGLVGVDIPDAHDDLGIHQQDLDGRFPIFDLSVQVFGRELGAKGFWSQVGKPFMGIVDVIRQQGAKTPGVVIAQNPAAIECYFDMVVLSSRGSGIDQSQTSRHAKMDQQAFVVFKFDKQIFGPSINADDVPIMKPLGQIAAHRPAQTGVVDDGVDDPAAETVRFDAAAGGFDFRQFGHDVSRNEKTHHRLSLGGYAKRIKQEVWSMPTRFFGYLILASL